MTAEKARSLPQAMTLLLALLTAAILMAPPLLKSITQVSWDYNEGWNAYHADHALGEEPLYPGLDQLYSNNYPPLSFYIVGGLGRLIGDNIMAGRLLSTISLIVVALCIGLILHRLGCSRVIASCCGLVYLGFMAGYNAKYVGMNDPQMLGHAIMLTGFVIFLAGKRSRDRLFMTALFMVAAGLVKHNLVAFPLALTAWIFCCERQAFRSWITISLLLLVSALLALYSVFGMPIFDSLLSAPRSYWIMLGVENFTKLTLPAMLYLSGAFLFLVSSSRLRCEYMLVSFYVIISGIWALLILGGAGVDKNALYDLIIASIIACGLFVEVVAGHVQALWSRASVTVAALLVLQLPQLILLPQTAYRLVYLPEILSNQELDVSEEIDLIAGQDGPVLCESLALCYWAGKAIEVDVFNAGQKLFTGYMPEGVLTDRIGNHYFSIVQIANNSGTSSGWPDSINKVLLQNYEVTRKGGRNSVLLVPRLK